DIDALIKCRLFQAGPHAGAGGQVDDLVKFDAAEQVIETGTVGEIALSKSESFGLRLEVADVGEFDFRIVEIVQIIEGPNRVAIAQQPLANVVADEARAARHQKIHERMMKRRVPGSKLQVCRLSGRFCSCLFARFAGEYYRAA